MGTDRRHSPSEARLETSLIDDELVVLCLDSGYYYTITGIGVIVWQLIERGASLGLIVETIAQRYEQEAQKVQANIETFLDKLVLENLVGPAESTDAADPATIGEFDGWQPTYIPVTISKYNDLFEAFASDPPLVVGRL
ncbi:PqqD family protein [Rhodovulum tesquicola]|uniref:Coenzyme PQQ synthesis protein D (PqqD) n=1 Tax=Rhodovulum steppense TaxID=540251 RepID=A0A4R1YWJ2_9RHOB|nr:MULTISPECIES: PqqD family protein [Rhodovulum]MCO8146837.1 PqqD family protein [Rhodovulum tesquicola]TCM85528.1 coenzyme PQQ synthesis protein D (PqqD) [Rhodovulum steppense]